MGKTAGWVALAALLAACGGDEHSSGPATDAGTTGGTGGTATGGSGGSATGGSGGTATGGGSATGGSAAGGGTATGGTGGSATGGSSGTGGVGGTATGGAGGVAGSAGAGGAAGASGGWGTFIGSGPDQVTCVCADSTEIVACADIDCASDPAKDGVCSPLCAANGGLTSTSCISDNPACFPSVFGAGPDKVRCICNDSTVVVTCGGIDCSSGASRACSPLCSDHGGTQTTECFDNEPFCARPNKVICTCSDATVLSLCADIDCTSATDKDAICTPVCADHGGHTATDCIPSDKVCGIGPNQMQCTCTDGTSFPVCADINCISLPEQDSVCVPLCTGHGLVNSSSCQARSPTCG